MAKKIERKHFKWIIAIICLSLYFWLSYAYIYFKIGHTALPASDKQSFYTLFTKDDSKENLVYVSLGDSLTAGVGVDAYEKSYPFLIAQKFIRTNNVTLYDFAYPGAKTIDIIDNLLEPAIKAQPGIITLLIGTNDIHGHVSETIFRRNYSYILNRLSHETKAQIYAISIPPLGSNFLLLPPYNYYFRYKDQSYNKIIRDLAKHYKITYIDLYNQTLAASKKNSYYAADLFHPNAQSYQVWANLIYADINH